MHVVNGFCDVNVPVQELPGASRGAVGGGQGVGGAWGEVDVGLADHHHAHVVGAQCGRVVQLHAGAVLVVVTQLRVVPVVLQLRKEAWRTNATRCDAFT